MQNPISQVSYDAAHDQINYYSSATIKTSFSYVSEGRLFINCAFDLSGATSGLYIGDLIFSPSAGQILAECIPETSSSPTPPLIEIAYLFYVDTSNPSHVVYHFRGNDALFSIAQQMYGINFTGVELTFDVQAPST